MYTIIGPPNELMQRGVEACLKIGDERDLTPEMIDEIIHTARAERAVFEDGDGDEMFVIELPGRPKEGYTEGALRNSLKPYLVPQDGTSTS